MARRFITREDVKRDARDGVLMVAADDVVTAAAEEAARRRNIEIRVAKAAPEDPKRMADLPPQLERPAIASPMFREASDNHAIIAAVGRNRTFILAEITTRLAELNASILDISQTIVRDYFSTLIIADISDLNTDFKAFKEALETLSKDGDYRLTVQHESVFRAMHRI